MIWATNEYLLFAILLGCTVVVMELGFKLGRWCNLTRHAQVTPHWDSMQAAVLGLLALLLGFTFSMSVQRYDLRKAEILEEVTLISDAYDLADFLPPAQQAEFRSNLKAFLDARIGFYEQGSQTDQLSAIQNKTSQAQSALWQQVVAALHDQPTSIGLGQLAAKVNDLSDVSERSRALLDNHVPEAVLYMLFGVSLIGIGFVAVGYGMANERRHYSTALFAFVLTLVLLIILDIDRPHRGLVQISDSIMLRQQHMFETPSQ